MLKYMKDQANNAKNYVSNRLNAATPNRLAIVNDTQEQQVAPQPSISSSTMYRAAALIATISAGAIGAGAGVLLRNARLNAAKPAIKNEPKPEVQPAVQPVAAPVAQVVAQQVAVPNHNKAKLSSNGSFNLKSIKHRLKSR